MRSRLLLSCMLFMFIMACRQRQDDGIIDPSRAVKIEEVSGMPLVFNDSIKEITVVKAGAPVVVAAKPPKGVAFSFDTCHVHEEPSSLTIDLSAYRALIVEDGDNSFIEKVHIEPIITLMGIPEIVVARDMASMEKNSGNFSYFNSLHGLPSSVVRDVLVDRHGHVWIATTGGVSRYDGKNMYTYTRKQGLLVSDITTLFEDNHGNIWFGSYAGTLSRFDGKQLIQYTCKTDIVLCMTQDSKGNIWVGTKDSGTYYFDGKDFHYIRVEAPVIYWVNNIFENVDGNIWIAANNGIFIYDWKNMYSTDITKKCGSITTDSLGRIWVGIENEVYHSTGSGYVKWKPDDCVFRSSISQLFFDSFGQLWISTSQSGLALFDGESLSFFDKSTGLPGAKIETLDQDKSGAIWIAYSEGVCRYGGNLFTHYTVDRVVGCNCRKPFLHDSRNRLWFSSDEIQGVACIVGKEIYHYGRPEGFHLSHPYVMTEDKEGTIWFTEWGEGLCAFDGKTFATYTRKQGLFSDTIHAIAVDSAGAIWCATRLGISRFESDRSRFTNYVSEGEFGVDFRYITAGQHNDVWMAGNERGLFHFRSDQEAQIKRYGQLGMHTQSILVDDNEFLWFGGHENGLDCFDGKRSYHFTPEGLGMQNTFVSSIEDHQGNLWFGTSASGLFRLDYKKFEDWKGHADSLSTSDSLWYVTDYAGLFTRFGPEEGFLPLTVLPTASARDGEGNLWFGTTVGFTKVKAVREHIDTVRPVIKVISIKLFNEQMNWMAVKNGTQGTLADNIDPGNIEFDSTSSFYNLPVNLSLPNTDNNINFEYNAINLAGGKSIHYQYKLDGIDQGWSTPTKNTEVNYGPLSPGHYVFMVKGQIRDGYWSSTYEYPFRIRPPWWQTWWAYLFYATSVGAIIYLLRKYDLHRQQLKHNLELEKVEANKLKELDVVKSRLYTNITHEFRTPLTVILGMADQIEKKPEQPIQERIELIRRNGRQLLSLVNQMLDLSKIESQQMKIHEIQSDIITYLQYIVESFHSMAAAKDVRLKVNHPPGPFMMDYDPVRILQIISNLLSNAIKFTPPGGEILLTVEPNDKLLKIVISDTGIGIHPEQLPHIFSRFYQADSSSTRQGEGTGIGLTLTQELVKLLSGVIRVESQMNKGTTFFIELPVKRTASFQTDHQISGIESNSLTQQSSFAEEVADVESHSHESLPLLLIIEDNADVTRYLVSCLEDQYQVVTALNGQLGIDKALELVPDIIITDVMMPLKDGFEVCDTLKKDTRTSHIPIIILTAKATVEDRIAGLERGADAYLAKPFHQEELIVQLRNLITTRQKLQERYRQLEAPMPQATPDEKIEDAFVLKFRGLIEAELDNAELSIDDICRKMMMSRTQIHRKITALTDRSTSLFIRSIRLQHGKRLLQSTDLNVSEVAYRVGFDDPKYFSRVFQEEFQVAPSEVKGMHS